MFGAAPGYRAYGLLTSDPLPIQQILSGAAGKLRLIRRRCSTAAAGRWYII